MSIAILTRAGISAKSWLGSFSDKHGLWTRYSTEDVATLETYARLCGSELVLYGEEVRFRDPINAVTEMADLFALFGTSGNVHPAAGLIKLARDYAAAAMEINLEPSAVEPQQPA